MTDKGITTGWVVDNGEGEYLNPDGRWLENVHFFREDIGTMIELFEKLSIGGCLLIRAFIREGMLSLGFKLLKSGNKGRYFIFLQ